MKVLVATKEGQGVRSNDFCWTNEGELVTFGSECSNEAVDGACGCRRAMSGLDTLKATTTITVVDMDITYNEYVDRIKESVIKGGWSIEPVELDSLAREDADELLRIANLFPVGCIIEKRGQHVQERVLDKH